MGEGLHKKSLSPFGRGVTEGDGEGKPVAKQLLHSDEQGL